MKRKIIAIVPAAGVGARMQADKPKQYLSVAGKTILEHTLARLSAHEAISEIIVALGAEDPYWAALALENAKIRTVTGGETRAQSVLNGLNAIADEKAWVLVHDAARPCVRLEDIDKLLHIKNEQGAILAIPAIDTIKRANAEAQIVVTEDRAQLWQAQTPQFFPAKALRDALSQALEKGVEITDEASAMEFAGAKPQLVAGHADNIKVTRPEDLALAAFYLTKEQA